MTKLVYFDCPTGVSGDMCLGALVDLGVAIDYLGHWLDRLGLAGEYRLHAAEVQRNGQRATHVEVNLTPSTAADVPRSPLGTVASIAVKELSEKELSDRAIALEPYHTGRWESVTDSLSGTSHPHDHHHDHSHDESHSHPHPHSHAHDPAPPHSHAHDRPHDEPHHHPHLSSHAAHPSHGRGWPEIAAMIRAAGLPQPVEDWSLAVFRHLAIAEGAVHGIPPETVHFHEVGAVDAIVDIVGTCLGLHWLGVEAVFCSALPTGGGTVRAAHGRLPVPVPAVLRLCAQRQVPLFYNGIDRELVTPTGAALMVALAQQFGPPPPLVLQQVGLGAGSQELSLPNILRLWVGEAANSTAQVGNHGTGAGDQLGDGASEPPGQTAEAPGALFPQNAEQETGLETVGILETQIDDLSPQAIAYALEQVFAAGALDAFSQPVTMKKSRLGVLLTVVCPLDRLEVCEEVLFRETTTLGIRRSYQARRALDRWFETVETGHGPVRLKLAGLGGEVLNVQPEYEDVAAIARRTGLAWQAVQQAALAAWGDRSKN